MKKGVVLGFCLLLLLGSGAFALEKAAGGGILVGGTFQGGDDAGASCNLLRKIRIFCTKNKNSLVKICTKNKNFIAKK